MEEPESSHTCALGFMIIINNEIMLEQQLVTEDKRNDKAHTMKHDAWFRSSSEYAYFSSYSAVVVTSYS